MKKIKTYESFFREPEYNVNDYVLIYHKHNEQHVAKIIKYHKLIESYLMYVYDFNSEKWIGYNSIIRKLTSEEKLDFEMRLNANKYNL